MSQLSFFFLTRGQLFFLEAYQILPLITHWPELGHMAVCISEEMSTFFFKVIQFLFIYLFIYGCVGSSFLCEGFLQLRQVGATLHCSARAFIIAASLVAEHRLQTRRLSNCGSRAQLLRGMWDLPRPGLEPVCPALAGRFSTTAPPGKPSIFLLQRFIYFLSLNYVYISYEYQFETTISEVDKQSYMENLSTTMFLINIFHQLCYECSYVWFWVLMYQWFSRIYTQKWNWRVAGYVNIQKQYIIPNFFPKCLNQFIINSHQLLYKRSHCLIFFLTQNCQTSSFC